MSAGEIGLLSLRCAVQAIGRASGKKRLPPLPLAIERNPFRSREFMEESTDARFC